MFKGNLRDVKDEDLLKIFQWRNQQFIRDVMFNSNLIEWNQHVNWYNSFKDSESKLVKIFTYKGEDYGVLSLNEIEKTINKCSWGFYIGNKEAPKGIGLLLGFESLEYIFKDLKIRKVCAEVIESNLKSRNFHEKLGFKLDGILRMHIKRDKHFENIYVYSLFSEEWKEKSQDIKIELEVRFR